KKIEGKKKELAKELEDLRLQLRQRIIDAQNIFSDTIGKTAYSLETMESLTTMRKKLIPELERKTDELNKNVEGISDEINEELAANYKSLLDSLNKLKNEIRAAEDEVERLASTSKWIKEQLAQREKELAEKDKEAELIKAELSKREEELQKVKADLQKELEAREAESKKIQEDLKRREEELKALKTESSLSKAELEKRQRELEEQIAKTKEELDAKASESEQIKEQLKAKESELTGVIEKTKKELEAKATDVEATKEQLQQQLKEREKELEEIKIKTEKYQKQIDEKNQELAEKESQLKALQTKIKDGLEVETKKLKSELDELIHFLEKSPKYQLLYLINNEEQTTLTKIQDVFKFDVAIIRTILEELNQSNYISVKKQNGDLLVKIEQKLNPISCIELNNIFENKMLLELNKLKDHSSINKYFDKCIHQIDKYKDTNKQEAGFLLSLLYLYIYTSKNYELFNKIRPLYAKLKDQSFYLRLIENALTYDPWESRKPAILENLMDFPKLTIMNKKFEEINEKDEDYPKNGPFRVKKYKPITLIDWEKETNVKKSEFNQFSTVRELVKWVWLNGKGSNFGVTLINSKGKSFEIIVATSEKVDAHLIMKQNELIAS
ncbi:MAG: hypothetical protein ACTSR3_16335, partial [Candidatus Helarchaeota archaeon]